MPADTGGNHMGADGIEADLALRCYSLCHSFNAIAVVDAGSGETCGLRWIGELQIKIIAFGRGVVLHGVDVAAQPSRHGSVRIAEAGVVSSIDNAHGLPGRLGLG